MNPSFKVHWYFFNFLKHVTVYTNAHEHTHTQSKWPCVLFIYHWLFEAEFSPVAQTRLELTVQTLLALSFPSVLPLCPPAQCWGCSPVSSHLTLWAHCMLLMFLLLPQNTPPIASSCSVPQLRPGHSARGKGLQNNCGFTDLFLQTPNMCSVSSYFFVSSMEIQLFYI